MSERIICPKFLLNIIIIVMPPPEEGTGTQSNLRQTDFLPGRFDGNTLDQDICTAHFLSFCDYLEIQNLDQPKGESELNHVVKIFKRTLQGQARLWIEDRSFTNLSDLKKQFIYRFSPTHSQFANVKQFDTLTYVPGDTADQHFTKVKQAAERVGYGEPQIRDKFLSSLPIKCQSAVIMSVPENAPITDLVQRAQRYLDLDMSQVNKEVTFALHEEDPIAKIREELHTMQLDSEKHREALESVQKLAREGARAQDRSPKRDRSWSRDRRSDRGYSPGRGRGRGSRRESPSTRRTMFCDYCLYPGHKWRNCRKRQSDLQRRRDGSRSSERQNNYQSETRQDQDL